VHNCTPQLLQKVVRKTAPQSCSRNQFSKVSPRSCPKTESSSPKLLLKLLPKIPCKSISESCCSSKQVFLKIVPDNCPKLLPKVVPGRCSLKLFPKAAVQSCYPKLRFFKTIPHNGSSKLFCKAAPESCSPKLLLRAALKNDSFGEELYKATLGSRSRKQLSGAVLAAVRIITLGNNFGKQLWETTLGNGFGEQLSGVGLGCRSSFKEQLCTVALNSSFGE
jgi:hypothetical protein